MTEILELIKKHSKALTLFLSPWTFRNTTLKLPDLYN